jgi:hypothetical protein
MKPNEMKSYHMKRHEMEMRGDDMNDMNQMNELARMTDMT